MIRHSISTLYEEAIHWNVFNSQILELLQFDLSARGRFCSNVCCRFRVWAVWSDLKSNRHSFIM
jgi:hypothetical protein